MKQTLKGTKAALCDYLVRQLSVLNREIIDAARDGDVLRRDIIETKIDTLADMYSYLYSCGIRFCIDSHYIKAEIARDGVSEVPQYILTFDNSLYFCDACLHDYPDEKILEIWEMHNEKKGA